MEWRRFVTYLWNDPRNAKNVRLQRRRRPTDDASTRRWRGSQ